MKICSEETRILCPVGKRVPIEERTGGLTPEDFHRSQRPGDKDLSEAPASPPASSPLLFLKDMTHRLCVQKEHTVQSSSPKAACKML